MTHDFTSDGVKNAAETGFKAIQAYAKKRGLCGDCLSAYTVLDMLYHIVKNLVADEQLPRYRELINLAFELARAQRGGGCDATSGRRREGEFTELSVPNFSVNSLPGGDTAENIH